LLLYCNLHFFKKIWVGHIISTVQVNIAKSIPVTK
jgi:hypothetical protein